LFASQSFVCRAKGEEGGGLEKDSRVACHNLDKVIKLEIKKKVAQNICSLENSKRPKLLSSFLKGDVKQKKYLGVVDG
jgi:hypothetical protein